MTQVTEDRLNISQLFTKTVFSPFNELDYMNQGVSIRVDSFCLVSSAWVGIRYANLVSLQHVGWLWLSRVWTRHALFRIWTSLTVCMALGGSVLQQFYSLSNHNGTMKTFPPLPDWTKNTQVELLFISKWRGELRQFNKGLNLRGCLCSA